MGRGRALIHDGTTAGIKLDSARSACARIQTSKAVSPVVLREFPAISFAMNALKILLAVACLVLASPPASQAAPPTRDQIIGLWLEFHPGDNLCYYAKDGTYRIYLKKGEIGEMRTLDGTWVLQPNGQLVHTVSVNGKELLIKTRVNYDGVDLEVTAEDGSVTTCRRHKGPIPDRFNW